MTKKSHISFLLFIIPLTIIGIYINYNYLYNMYELPKIAEDYRIIWNIFGLLGMCSIIILVVYPFGFLFKLYKEEESN